MSTPIRPERLTFPPDHQEPDLSRSDDGYPNDSAPPNERPGSSRFNQFVCRDCHGINSPQFAGSTLTIRLEHPSWDSRVWSPATKHNKCPATVNHLCISPKPTALITMDMVIHTLHTLITHTSIARLCLLLQPHDATPRRCPARLRYFLLRSPLLNLYLLSPRP